MNFKKALIISGICSSFLFANVVKIENMHKVNRNVLSVEQTGQIKYINKKEKEKKVLLKKTAKILENLQPIIQSAIILNRLYIRDNGVIPLKIKNNAINVIKKKVANLEKILKNYKENKIILNILLESKEFRGDFKTAKKIKFEIKKDIALNNFIPARINMSVFADELDEHIYFLTKKELEKYLNEIKKEIQKNNIYAFLNVSTQLINSIHDKLIIFPYPLIKISALINEVKKELQSNHYNRKQILNMLNEIHYQFKLADIFGYLPYNSSLRYSIENEISFLGKIIGKNNGTSKGIEELIDKIKNGIKKLGQESAKKIANSIKR